MTLPRNFPRHEGIVLVTVILLAIVVGTINPGFFSFYNVFSLLKNSTVVGLFAIGFFLVLVVGGLDVSFTSIGVVAMYGTVKLALAFYPDAPLVILLVVTALIGATLGLINGLLVTRLRAPSLIVTLGTMSLYRGFLLYFIGTNWIRQVPSAMIEFNRFNILVMTAQNGAQVGLHISVAIFLAVVAIVFLVLRYTTLGRSLYAVGGNPVAARRMGINVEAVETLAYCMAGTLAGIAGFLSAVMLRLANPQTLTGSELDVIAAAVLGGAAITGGKGSVIGVFLGVLLIVITNDSLIVLGIPAAWQKVAIGLLLLVAIGMPLLGARRFNGFAASDRRRPGQSGRGIAMRVLQSIDSRLATLSLAAILIAGTLGLVRPDTFLSPLNINSMLLQSSVIGMLSLAVAVTMLTGGIDLSINAIANLSSIVVAILLSKMVPAEGGNVTLAITALALVVGLLVGFGCGLFNGFLIAILGYSPILATLSTMTLFIGIGTVLTGGNTLFGISAFATVGRGSVLGIPLPAIIFLLAALVLSLVLEARRFGFYVYLYGANESAARFSGINEHRLLLSVYAVSGILSAVAGLINLGVTNSANVDFGSSYVLLAILISVLGGISASGGAGRIIGVVLAVLILQFLSTGLNLVFQSSGSNFLKEFAWGATLLVVLAIGGRRYSRLGRASISRGQTPTVKADSAVQP